MPVDFDYTKNEEPIIKVIGIGGGGCNAVKYMYQEGITGVDFAICNTDMQSLLDSQIPNQISLGPNLTEGRGAGSKPEIGRQACEESIGEIVSYLGNNTKMLFIAAGMGGGTGTGAAPIIAKAAQELGILTIAIVTLPFKFEGSKRERYARKGIDELKANTDALIIVSNDKLQEIHGSLPISEAFTYADNILSSAAKGISEIITVPGYINTDFEDVNTIMRDSGVAIMGKATAEGNDRATKVIAEALNSPLLDDNDMLGANDILFHVTSGTKEVTLDEITEITNYIEEAVGEDCNIIWGNSFDSKLGEKISITIVATGFQKTAQANPVVKTVKEELIMEEEATHSAPEFISIDEDTEDVIMINNPGSYQEVSTVKDTIQSVEPKEETPIEAAIRGNKSKEPYFQTNGQAPINFDGPEESSEIHKSKPPSYKNLDQLEAIPAYIRRKVQLDDVPKAHEYKRSTLVVDTEGEPNVRKDNPYLYDNVD